MGARSTGSHPTTTKADGHLLEYFRQNFGVGGGANSGPTSATGLTASGGIISDYADGPAVYRAHIFTSSGRFTVSEIGTLGNNIEYLVVGGGGGGGENIDSTPSYYENGGGGAGGFRTNLSGHPRAGSAYQVSAQTYTVVVGAGGGTYPVYNRGFTGGNSEFYPPGASYPSTARIRGAGGGGGGGGYLPGTQQDGGNGGSGGGAARGASAGNGGATLADPNHPQPQGNVGGGSPSGAGGGGGGAGQAGYAGNDGTFPGRGGDGLQCLIAGTSTYSGIGALNPGPGEYQWFAGGGGGSIAGAAGGVGGGGQGGTSSGDGRAGEDAKAGTGGGGGGQYISPFSGGKGGSGVVVVRYQIAELASAIKGTGGSVSFYGGKTIHVFTSAGDFNNTTGAPLSVDVVMIGGGGAGGGRGSVAGRGAGGGGAGGYVFSPATTISPGPNAVVIGSGGAALGGGVGNNGTPTTFAGITAWGGGGGGGVGNVTGQNGGSGGGAANAGFTVDGGLGQRVTGTSTPSTNTGNPGGYSLDEASYGGGGGGGAGGAGSNFDNPPNTAGPGGVGIQIPAAFQNPALAPSGDSPLPYQRGGGVGTPGPGGSFYIGGGGAGGAGNNPGMQASGGAGGGGQGMDYPYSPPYPTTISAVENTGSGGGGGISNPDYTIGGHGGSGIVLIAYPS